jgi:hypothetical protein
VYPTQHNNKGKNEMMVLTAGNYSRNGELEKGLEGNKQIEDKRQR